MRIPTINYRLKNEVAVELHFQLCSACYTALQTKNSRRSASAINAVTTKVIWTIYTSQLSLTDSKEKWSLCFAFSYVYTVLQMKNSRGGASTINPGTIQNTDNSHLQSHALPQIDTLGCQQKEIGHKGQR